MPPKKPHLLRRPASHSLLEPDVLAIVGPDRLVKDDISPYGLHRRHVIRYGGLPDVESWRGTVPENASSWTVMDDKDIGHLWMAWKET